MNQLSIQSHRGPYFVRFDEDVFQPIEGDAPRQYVVDEKVAGLYREPLARLTKDAPVLTVEASELTKSLPQIDGYVRALVASSIRRDHILVAVGGGVIQDIVCFLASTLFRGMEWHFYPTTLLAQADSCIGSKSSINAGGVKNLMGTFHPPRQVVIAPSVLATLSHADICSGIGEMIKVHAIDGPEAFDRIAASYDRLFDHPDVMVEYLRHSLAIKKSYIETDEFDRGPRNIFNYGHSFGHALETVTNYQVPHGIAITIGMDLANYVSSQLGQLPADDFQRMHHLLKQNYSGYETIPVSTADLLKALKTDKKNAGSDFVLILPQNNCRIERQRLPNDPRVASLCEAYFAQVRAT